VSFYVSTATFFLLHCDEWDRVVALPRHKFVTGAILLQLICMALYVRQYNKEVSCFNIEWSPLLSLPDNDMIDEDINDILLQINMSEPPESPESRRCVLVAFTCRHIMSVINMHKKLQISKC
jgi:hypothetical protein